MTPRELAERIEHDLVLPPGNQERFDGYGVMALPFTSGHVLVMRRFPVSSIGPGYTSVWHRNQTGDWDFYSDAEPALSCSRFFGSSVKRTFHQPIQISWTSPYRFKITIAGTDFEWEITASASLASTFMNKVASYLPAAAWQNETVLKLMGAAAGFLLGVGKVGLTGITSNRQQFKVNPRHIWLIRESKASLNGEDFGQLKPLPEQIHLGGFYLPQKGILAFGQVYFEPFDPQKHIAAGPRS